MCTTPDDASAVQSFQWLLSSHHTLWISFQFYHQHYRTSSTMLSCTICSFPETNKIPRYFQCHSLFSVFSKHHNRLRILFWQQAVYSNYHYSLLNKPLDISTQEFIFDALTTSIQWLFHKDQRETQGTKNETIRNCVYGVGGLEIWNSNILEKLNLACLLQGLRS